MDGSAPATTTTEITPRSTRALDRELYCPRLDRLLTVSASELGLRGNLAQVVASIERGGAGGGGEDPNLSMLRRLGATDRSWISRKAQMLTEIEQQWRLLDAKQQTIALAHYLGTPRAHATIRERFGAGQGGLAGVVLYRWQRRQAKQRARASSVGSARLLEQLDAVRAELAPLEREMATLVALLEQPLPDPGAPPERPEDPPLVLRRKHLLAWWRPYRLKRAEWAAPVKAARQRRQEAAARCNQIVPLLPPLRAEQARLSAALADVVAAPVPPSTKPNSPDPSDYDELALVRLCRSGNLDADEHTTNAEREVRGLHRAWYAARKKLIAAEVAAEDATA